MNENSLVDFNKIDTLIFSKVGTKTRWVQPFKDNKASKHSTKSYINCICKSAFNLKRKYNNTPYYDSDTDIIHLPAKKKFSHIDHYYATYMHEIIHSTGHKERLHRIGIIQNNDDNSIEYAMEEVIAEIGALYFIIEHKLNKAVNQSFAYINGYAKARQLTTEEISCCMEQAKIAYKMVKESMHGKLYKV